MNYSHFLLRYLVEVSVESDDALEQSILLSFRETFHEETASMKIGRSESVNMFNVFHVDANTKTNQGKNWGLKIYFNKSKQCY